MHKNAVVTIAESRPLTNHETEIVNWMLRYAVPAGRLRHLMPAVSSLRVVGRCSCGCASVDFENSEQSAQSHPIADTMGETTDGAVGLILWGHDNSITGLEIYALDSTKIDVLPSVANLLPWPTA